MQMFGSGLDLVQATLRNAYPSMKFLDGIDAESDNDDEYIDSEDSEVMKAIGERMTGGDHLVVRRENKGLSQSDLSKLTGIAIPNISLMEAGKRPIGARTARKLAAALDCDAGDFIS